MKALNLYDNHKVYYSKKGYAVIWCSGKNKMVHVLEWEKYHGPKPIGFEIHHIDQDKGNWYINNLELLSNSDHRRVHAGWVRHNGIWIMKPCKDCKQLLPLDSFYQRKGLTPYQRCIPCSGRYFKAIRTEGFIKKRKEYSKNYYRLNKHKWVK